MYQFFVALVAIFITTCMTIWSKYCSINMISRHNLNTRSLVVCDIIFTMNYIYVNYTNELTRHKENWVLHLVLPIEPKKNET